MTTPNHTAGGLVFTGTMLSFWNVNLFSSPIYITACVLFSLLADIDTPKTIIGGAVHPIAKWINRRYGHRTLTHSLTFFGLLLLFIMILRHFTGFDEVYVKIYIFAYLSHLILDMMTIQGVPLLYPFKKNPCVLPSDPNFRLTTGNAKSETIAFVIFVLLGFTMYPLYSQGFWTTYNREFGTVSHCDRQFNSSNNWIICEYEYIKNDKVKRGEAYILTSTTTKLELYDSHSKEVFDLDMDDKSVKIIKTKPRNDTSPRLSKEVSFMNITVDSVNRIMRGKVCTGLIQALPKLQYVEKGITYYSNIVRFTNDYNFQILQVADTVKSTLLEKLQIVNAKFEQKRIEQSAKYEDLNKLKKKEFELRERIKLTPDSAMYRRNKLQNELIELTTKLKSADIKTTEVDLVLTREKESIKKQLESNGVVLVSGVIIYYIF